VCRRLERKDPSRLDGELSEPQSTVKQGYREARRYLERLRSGASRGPDVDEAARELVNEFRARSDVQIDLYASAAGVPARHGVGSELLQIVREGLTNILLHADATTAAVTLEVDTGGCDLIIRDDGRGFPDSGRDGATALPASAAPWSIRGRVEALGGSLSLVRLAGGGSEIHIRLPLELQNEGRTSDSNRDR
jgi:two-component system NarL family sensor kinase